MDGDETQSPAAPACAVAGLCRARVWVPFLAVTVLGLAADLASKESVFRSLMNPPGLDRVIAQRQMVFGPISSGNMLRQLNLHRHGFGWVSYTLSTNPGIVFSLPMPRWAVVIFTLGAIGLVLYFLGHSPTRSWSLHVALGMILGGAMGNLYDRLASCVALPGMDPIRYQVRDFLDVTVSLGSWQWRYPYLFNVADALLVSGVAIILLHWLVAGHKTRRA